jgi:hypothetical protein
VLEQTVERGKQHPLHCYRWLHDVPRGATVVMH